MTTYLCAFLLSPGVMLRVEMDIDTKNYGADDLRRACEKYAERLDAMFLYYEEVE